MAAVIDISDIIHAFDHAKAISVSQLINSKSRDLKKLLKYFNGTTTSVPNIFLLFCVVPVNFVLYSKDSLVIVLLLFILIRAASFSFASPVISSLK